MGNFGTCVLLNKDANSAASTDVILKGGDSVASE